MSTVIKIENLWKEYRLGVIGHGTLTHDLQSWWAKIRCKEDPNAKIAPMAGQEKQIEGDHFWALQDINLEVMQGDILGIIGKNGAGKSTLLKVLSRVTAPSRGNIKVKGRIASLLEVGTGFHPELTGRENIFMNGAILGMSRLEINSKLDEIIDFSGVENFVDTPVKRYSSGMYVRLAFAVAAHLEPEILIIDEVLAVGDAEFQKKCLGKMEAVSNEGRTILFVSHNMGSIKKLCSKCLWLDAGMVVEKGETGSIISSYMRGTSSKLSNQAFFEESASKEGQLRQVRMLNEAKEISYTFSCDENILVELIFQVNKVLPGMYGYFGVYDSTGTALMVSDSFDTDGNPLDNLGIGLHRIVVTIPARSLASGEYQVHLSFASSAAHSFHVDIPGIVTSFVLEDYTSVRGNDRPGFFSTMLDWNVSLADDKSLDN